MSLRLLVPTIATVLAWPASTAFADELPSGPGRETVASTCGGCHNINRIRVGYTPDGWRTVMHMMQTVQAPVPADQWPVVT